MTSWDAVILFMQQFAAGFCFGFVIHWLISR